jgi:hypothetical protein
LKCRPPFFGKARIDSHGIGTSIVEVNHVSTHGFWLLLADEELLVPFALFPWFRKATIEQIADVQLPTPNHPSCAVSYLPQIAPP